MEVKNRWIISAILAMFLLIIVATWGVQYFNLDTRNDTTYSYKEKLFKEDEVATIDIQIDEEDYNDLLENPLEEEYKKASITINGETISNVAVRTKGNSSLTMVASSDSDRYSLKVDFNYYDSSQSFYGLTKLNLNNNISDSSQMREFVSYEMMEKMGINVPAHSYMNVTINGEPYGLLLGVEAIDQTYIKNYYKTSEGYLFKPDGTGSDLVYISDDLDDYSGIEVKMNEKDVEDSNIISFIKVINTGENVEDYLDVDQALRYFAMNTALVSLDSYQGQMKHNYYLYENNDGLFSILPWDYNMSFGGFGLFGGGGPSNNEDRPRPENNEGLDLNQELSMDNFPQMPNGQGMGMMESELMSDSSINFSIYEPVSGTTMEERPLLNVLLSNETYLAQYEAYLEEIATSIFTEETVQDITTKLADLLKDYVEADPSKFYTTEQFLEGVTGENSLPEFAKQRGESILKQLSGEYVAESLASSGNGMTPPQMDGQMNNPNIEQNGNFGVPPGGNLPPQMNQAPNGQEGNPGVPSGGNIPPQMNQAPNGQEGNPGVPPGGNLPPQMNQAPNGQEGNPGVPSGGNMPPEMNQAPNGQGGGMRGNMDISSMTDEEFDSFLEMLQSGNIPFTLPDEFEQMTTEEKKAYIAGQMEQMLPNGNPQQGGPMMNNEASNENETTGDFTKEDIYRYSFYLILMLIAIVIVRKIGR